MAGRGQSDLSGPPLPRPPSTARRAPIPNGLLQKVAELSPFPGTEQNFDTNFTAVVYEPDPPPPPSPAPEWPHGPAA